MSLVYSGVMEQRIAEQQFHELQVEVRRATSLRRRRAVGRYGRVLRRHPHTGGPCLGSWRIPLEQ